LATAIIIILLGVHPDWVIALVSPFWSLCATEGVDPWIERVSSEANLADPVSRNKRPNVVELATIASDDAALRDLTRRSASDALLPYTSEAAEILRRLALVPTDVPSVPVIYGLRPGDAVA
jgi:hypothetical protein